MKRSEWSSQHEGRGLSASLRSVKKAECFGWCGFHFAVVQAAVWGGCGARCPPLAAGRLLEESRPCASPCFPGSSLARGGIVLVALSVSMARTSSDEAGFPPLTVSSTRSVIFCCVPFLLLPLACCHDCVSNCHSEGAVYSVCVADGHLNSFSRWARSCDLSVADRFGTVSTKARGEKQPNLAFRNVDDTRAVFFHTSNKGLRVSGPRALPHVVSSFVLTVFFPGERARD